MRERERVNNNEKKFIFCFSFLHFLIFNFVFVYSHFIRTCTMYMHLVFGLGCDERTVILLVFSILKSSLKAIDDIVVDDGNDIVESHHLFSSLSLFSFRSCECIHNHIY